MKTNDIRRWLTYFAALCYVIFLFIDYLMPSAHQVSSALKYVGLLCCATVAVTGPDGALRAAMLLTAGCDFLLLFTENYVPGILAFACAQTLHALRHAAMAGLRARFAVIPAILAAAAGSGFYLFAQDAQNSAAIAYGVMLLTASALAVAAFLRGKCKGNIASRAAGGMLLFIACDICVALFNTGHYAAGNLMWLFYLPSQLLLVMSARPAPLNCRA